MEGNSGQLHSGDTLLLPPAASDPHPPAERRAGSPVGGKNVVGIGEAAAAATAGDKVINSRADTMMHTGDPSAMATLK